MNHENESDSSNSCHCSRKRSIIDKTMMVISFVSVSAYRYAPGPMLVELSYSVGETVQQMPIVFIARSMGYIIGYICGTLVFDILLTTNQLQLYFFLCLIVMGSTAFFATLSRQFLSLLIVFLVAGICFATFDTGVTVFCIDILHQQRNLYFQVLHFAYAVGAFFGVLSSRPHVYREVFFSSNSTGILQLNSTHPYSRAARPFFMITGLLMFMAFMWLCRYCFSLTNEEELPEEHVSSQIKDTIKRHGRIFNVVAIFLMSISSFVAATLDLAYPQILYCHVVVTLTRSYLNGSDVTSLFFVCYTFSRFIGLFIMNRVNPMKIILVDVVFIASAGFLMMGYVEIPSVNIWLSNCILGFGTAFLLPATLSILSDNIYVTHKIISPLFIMSSTAEMIFPYLLIRVSSFNVHSMSYFVLSAAVSQAILLFCQFLLFEEMKIKRHPAEPRSSEVPDVAPPPPPAATGSPWKLMQRLSQTHIDKEKEEEKKGSEEEKKKEKKVEERVGSQEILERLDSIKLRVLDKNTELKKTIQQILISSAELKSETT